MHVSASLSHEGRGESEFCIDSEKSARGVPSPLVGEGKHSSPRYHSEMGEGPLRLGYHWRR